MCTVAGQQGTPQVAALSDNDKNGEELCLKNCEGILDNELSVLNILKRLKAKNERMIDSETHYQQHAFRRQRSPFRVRLHRHDGLLLAS